MCWPRGVPRWVGWLALAGAVVWVPLVVPEPSVPLLGSDVVAAVAFTAYTVWFLALGILGVVLTLRPVGPR
jgi:hypothetical protein